jgi:cell division protein FtsI/penicillin-binding protein 2
MMQILRALLILFTIASLYGTYPLHSQTRKKTASQSSATKRTNQQSAGAAATARKSTARRRTVQRRMASPWKEPSYADSTEGDFIDGEDLVVRRAAVEALWPYNGSVVVADPHTGRILTIVNQKLAFKSGFIPCSTIKIVVAMAALQEGLIERDTRIPIARRVTMNLTEALARSNNPYFAKLGMRLGFEKVLYYSRLFGLGEKAVLGLDEEQPGALPSSPPKNGGVGMMSSFGEGILQTPLQLAAMLSALANGGTLYYLQWPRSQQEIDTFVPRVKRHLDIADWIPEIKPGLMGAVEYGTARRAMYSPEEPIFGKTGTCTDRNSPTHMGWFGSFNEVQQNKLVVVVMLTGGAPVNGPVASGIAGEIYQRLSSEQYFAGSKRGISPVAMVGVQRCCVQ